MSFQTNRQSSKRHKVKVEYMLLIIQLIKWCYWESCCHGFNPPDAESTPSLGHTHPHLELIQAPASHLRIREPKRTTLVAPVQGMRVQPLVQEDFDTPVAAKPLGHHPKHALWGPQPQWQSPQVHSRSLSLQRGHTHPTRGQPMITAGESSHRARKTQHRQKLINQ